MGAKKIKKRVKKKKAGKSVRRSAYPKARNEGAEVCEIFEVEGKGGKEKFVKTCGHVSSKPATKKELEHHNKVLGGILLILGAIIILFIGVYFAIDSIRHFEYNGVKFDVVNEQDLIFYRTTIPAMYQGKKVDYNFFIRTDPRKLEGVPFEGDFKLPKNLVVNLTKDFNCDGDGVIGIANLVKLYEFMRIPVIRDENASCSENGEYMFLQIQEGNSTEIKEIGPACYEMNVANCEILEATERLMVETFVKVQDRI